MLLKLQEAGIDRQTLLLLEVMFRNVVRRVTVGGAVSEEIKVTIGVPQGSVLSPWLYSSYINGLHDALRDAGVGVWVFGRLVPLLLFADDIVVLADSPEALTLCFSVLHSFSRKWRFKFNHKKCNVVAFGSRYAKLVARGTCWKLGEGIVATADSYKYLGVDVCSGSFRGRWKVMLDRFIAKALNETNLLIHQAGGRHGLRPRTITCLWKSKVRPILEYACELWEGELPERCIKDLEAVQSHFGRMVLGLKVWPAAVAVRADLGLATLPNLRRGRKLRYWGKLCRLGGDRLLAHIVRHRHRQVCAGRGRFSCLRAFRDLLCEVNLSGAWQDLAVHDDWLSVVHEAVRAKELQDERSAVSAATSLQLFRQLDQSYEMGTHGFLLDRGNWQGTRLMACLRYGTLWTMSRVASAARAPEAMALCRLCAGSAREDARHFLLECAALTSARNDLCRACDSILPQAGFAGRTLARVMREAVSSDPGVALLLIAGMNLCPPRPPGTESGWHVEECAKAAWLLDKIAKNYLVRCWRMREAILGRVRVVHRQIVWDPQVLSVDALKPFTPRSSFGPEWRACWLEWAPRVRTKARNSARARSNFFVVWQGSPVVAKVFYRWCDARNAARGPESCVRGFDTMAEAYSACLGQP